MTEPQRSKRRRVKGKNQCRDKIKRVVNDNGDIIEEQDPAHQFLEETFQGVYKEREVDETHEEWSQKVIEGNNRRREEERARKSKDNKKYDIKDLNVVIKSLKNRKARAEDLITNEFLKALDNDNRKYLLEIINNLKQKLIVPRAWKEGTLSLIYKGKGVKGNPKNDRGITVSSCMAKMVERLIKNDITEEIEITECQGGGIPGIGTRDHITIMNTIIQRYKGKNKTLHIVFLDVEKAFDKAWREGILHLMNKHGCSRNNWAYIDALNENNTVKIKTAWGMTKPIDTSSVLKQGSVLSPIQYGLLIDEISKVLEKERKGIIIRNNNIPCLLWVDDVALFNNEAEKLQEALDSLWNISRKYRIKFGLSKSKHLIIGTDDKPSFNLKLGPDELEKVEEYKYLGVWLNNKGNLDNHITHLEGKTLAAVYTILDTVSDKDLEKIEMDTLWICVSNTVDSIICYGLEGFTIRDKDYKKLNQMKMRAIRSLLSITTEIADLIIIAETNSPPIEYEIKKRKILYWKKIKELMEEELNREQQNDNSDNKTDDEKEKGKEAGKKAGKERKLFLECINDNKTWSDQIKRTMEELEIDEEDIKSSEETIKEKIKKKVEKDLKSEFESKSKSKSSIEKYMKRIEQNQEDLIERKEYMTSLSRHRAKTILKTRGGRFPCKTNYKYKNEESLKCRWCKTREENENHILSKCRKCPITLRNTTIEDFFGTKNKEEWRDLSSILIEYNMELEKLGKTEKTEKRSNR